MKLDVNLNSEDVYAFSEYADALINKQCYRGSSYEQLFYAITTHDDLFWGVYENIKLRYGLLKVKFVFGIC